MTKSQLIDHLLGMTASASNEPLHWSPNGGTVRFVSSQDGSQEIWEIEVDSKQMTRLTSGMGGVGHLAGFKPARSPDGDSIAYISDKSGADELWLWTSEDDEDRQLTRFGGRIEAFSWSPDGASLAVAANAIGTFHIYVVDLASSRAVQITHDDRYEVYPSFAPDGTILYVRLNDEWTDHDVIAINPDGTDARTVVTDTNFFDYGYGRTFGYPLVSPDGQWMLFRSHRSNWINYWLLNMDGSGDLQQLAGSQADQSEAAWSPDGRSVAFAENHNGTLTLKVADLETGAVRTVVQPEMGICSHFSWSPDGQSIAYLYETPTTPTDLWFVDIGTGERTQLTGKTTDEAGNDASLVNPEKIVYASWDGLPISAYVYRPVNHEPGVSYPGLMWIHGGPTSQFTDAFRPQVQFFVQQGYVVMLPNVRGSSGYGLDFEDLNNCDWGHGDLKDVIEGVRYLKSLPEIDPDHTGITGTSYGGIMSMAATVWTEPGVFHAAIPCSGYCDFVYMVGEEEIRHNKMMDYEFGKLPEAHDVYYRCSPIYWTQQATVPCFILHGTGQYPGSTSSLDFAMALEATYKPFWYKTYPDENYYVAGKANTRQMLLDMKLFLDFYLKGVPYSLREEDAPLTRVNGVLPYRTWLSTAPFYPPEDGPRYGFGESDSG